MANRPIDQCLLHISARASALAKHYDEAVRTYIDLIAAAGCELEEALLRRELGSIYTNQERYGDATDEFKLSISLFDKYGNEPEMAVSQSHLGRAALLNHDANNAWMNLCAAGVILRMHDRQTDELDNMLWFMCTEGFAARLKLYSQAKGLVMESGRYERLKEARTILWSPRLYLRSKKRMST